MNLLIVLYLINLYLSSPTVNAQIDCNVPTLDAFFISKPGCLKIYQETCCKNSACGVELMGVNECKEPLSYTMSDTKYTIGYDESLTAEKIYGVQSGLFDIWDIKFTSEDSKKSYLLKVINLPRSITRLIYNIKDII